MRLSQLARKLGVTQSDIIKYVETLDYSISLTVHSKIEESLLDELKEKFDPTGEKLQETETVKESEEIIHDIEDSIKSTDQKTAEITNISDLEIRDEQIAEINNSGDEVTSDVIVEKEVSEELANASNATENQQNEKDIKLQDHHEIETVAENKADSITPDEISVTIKDSATIDDEINTERYVEDESAVIRAKLVKLEGIKVVGKIDLPPPPKPKEKEDQTVTGETLQPGRKPLKGKNNRKNSNKRKSESLKDKQEREQRRQERERKALERKIKEKKKKHYIEKIEKVHVAKPSQSSIVKPKKEKSIRNRKPMIKKSKNPVKRFWHWLNGKYDSY